MPRFAKALSLGLLVLSLACASSPGVELARGQVAAGDLLGARRTLEQARSEAPRSVEVRVALGEVYYRLARHELDRMDDERAYLGYLEKAVRELVSALEIDPADHQPHFWLAVIDAYRGDLRGTLRGFRNVQRLESGPVSYTNLAEVYVYRGELHKAQLYNRRGWQKGAPRGVIVFNEMLITWKQGDLRQARRHFATLELEHPEQLRTINMSRLPEPPADFEAFAGYCCGSPACGPYMVQACLDVSQPVYDRERLEETILQELRIEMEARRRLEEIYRQRKELEIEVEGPEPEAGGP